MKRTEKWNIMLWISLEMVWRFLWIEQHLNEMTHKIPLKIIFSVLNASDSKIIAFAFQ